MDATQEQWRPVVGFEEFYEVSDKGRVKSLRSGQLKRLTVHKPSGYQMTGLSGNGRKITRHVHRMVLEAFVGPLRKGFVSCHNNGNPADNRLANLRYDTPSSNNFDKVRHGRDHNTNKTRCPQGHAYTQENIVPINGGRGCRICARKRMRDYMRRMRAQKRIAQQLGEQ